MYGLYTGKYDLYTDVYGLNTDEYGSYTDKSCTIYHILRQVYGECTLCTRKTRFVQGYMRHVVVIYSERPKIGTNFRVIFARKSANIWPCKISPLKKCQYLACPIFEGLQPKGFRHTSTYKFLTYFFIYLY